MSRRTARLAVVAVLFSACATLCTAGCQATTPVTQQKGSEAALSGGVETVSPVDQNQRGSVQVGGSTVVVMPGAIPEGAAAGSLVITVNNGPHAAANGDVKGQGRQDSGSQTDSKTATQSTTATQTTSVDPKAVADAAGAILEKVTPTGEAATLANAAIAAAGTGKVASPESIALLEKATAAAKAEKDAKTPPPDAK